MDSFKIIKPDDFASAIGKMVAQCGERVMDLAEDGLDAAEEYMITAVAAKSPVDSGEFARSWVGSGRKHKLTRYIKNKKTVPSKISGNIPLSNILEFSKTRGKPFIRRTIKANTGEAYEKAVETIKSKL